MGYRPFPLTPGSQEKLENLPSFTKRDTVITGEKCKDMLDASFSVPLSPPPPLPS